MKYTTVLFDLDGTLMNTLEDIRDSVNHTLAAHGFPERTLEQIRMSVGNASAYLMEKSLPQGRETPGFEDILAEYSDYYLHHNRIKTAPYEGVHEVLRRLAAGEYKLAVVSNKPDENAKDLVRQFFGDVVSVVIGESPTVRRKPAPDAVLAALKELNSSKWESVFIGDSEVDIKTAAAAGVDCISVSWGFRTREQLEAAGAALIVDKPSGLLKLV
ncbi:MAG: HAD family hydrolase [Oscillospiraceae bacterium]